MTFNFFFLRFPARSCDPEIWCGLFESNERERSVRHHSVPPMFVLGKGKVTTVNSHSWVPMAVALPNENGKENVGIRIQ